MKDRKGTAITNKRREEAGLKARMALRWHEGVNLSLLLP